MGSTLPAVSLEGAVNAPAFISKSNKLTKSQNRRRAPEKGEDQQS